MDEDSEHHMDWTQRDRLVERLDHLVASGRVTAQEAGRLRAAGGRDEFTEVVRSISLRHAEGRVDAAVASGTLSDEEADRLLARLRNGEHLRSIRAELGRLGSDSLPADQHARGAKDGEGMDADVQPSPIDRADGSRTMRR